MPRREWPHQIGDDAANGRRDDHQRNRHQDQRYVGLAYGAVWALGLGGLEDAPAVDQAAMVFTWMAGGATIGALLAFGEEVGWQGFLVPKVSAITTFGISS